VAKIKECLAIETLTRAVVVEMVERIEVSETLGEDGKKSLEVAVWYKFGLGANQY
jgi:hypothetical protein